MTYKGRVTNGVVVLEGEKPEEGTLVEVMPVPKTIEDLSHHPAFGIWRDRTDLPEDSGDASLKLRAEAERRGGHE